MKIFTTLLLLNFLIVKGFTQTPAWVDGMGGTGEDYGISITTDANNNVYSTGYFEGTVDFNPGTGIFTLAAVGDQDIFISKLDAAGNFQWGRSIGGVGQDRGRSICNDPAGNLYVIGSFSGTVDFDPGVGTNMLTSVGDEDIFILKIDHAGNLVWAKSIGSNSGDYGSSITLDASGNIYTTGHFLITADFDPGAGVFNLSVPGAGMFILKLDPSGNFIWAKAAGCPTQAGSAIEPASIVVDAAQSVYVTGHFNNLIDFDPGIGSYTLSANWNMQTYICKLNSSGNFVWAKNFVGNFNFGYSMTLDALANVYIGGMFSGATDFDPSGLAVFNLVPAGTGNDAYIVKLDSAGNLSWAKNMGGTTDDAILSLTSDASGKIYATGSYKGVADFDPSPTVYTLSSVGDFDIFVAKFDATGSFLWAKNMGGPGVDFGYGIGVDAFGNILVTGSYNSTCDFDSGPALLNLTAIGGSDAFILKLESCTFAINQHPANQTSAIGNSAQFAITTSVSVSLFQWQQNTGSGFVNLSNGGQYSGVTTASMTISNLLLAQNNFSFRCVVTQSNCVNISNHALLTVYDATGIEEVNKEDVFKVYPNPAKDLITIVTKNMIRGSFKLIDQTGRQILNGKLNGAENTIDVSSLSAGLYFVQIGNQKPLKLVKE